MCLDRSFAQPNGGYYANVVPKLILFYKKYPVSLGILLGHQNSLQQMLMRSQMRKIVQMKCKCIGNPGIEVVIVLCKNILQDHSSLERLYVREESEGGVSEVTRQTARKKRLE